jgi:hypothetical protein
VDAAQLAVKPLVLTLVAAVAMGAAGALAPPDEDELEEELLLEEDEELELEELPEEELDEDELDEELPFTTRAAALLVTLPAVLVTVTV